MINFAYNTPNAPYTFHEGVNNVATTSININIDTALKDKAQNTFEALGLDMSTAINMLLRKAIYQHEVPFEISVKKENRHAAFGYLRGKISVPDDFNEPLDDFMGYM